MLYREILKLTPGDTEVYNGCYYWLYFWILFCMAAYKTDMHVLLKRFYIWSDVNVVILTTIIKKWEVPKTEI